METCILVLIKNEQEYLDDFITYHLNLGIDHIFFLEDYLSKPHDFITMKYDEVTLIKASSFIDNEINEKHNQVVISKLCLRHIKENYDFEWCFVIDSDEFLTLEDSNTTLNEVMAQFKNYDSVILQWKNYGANGLVFKPDYSAKHITEIFTKETKTDYRCDYTTKVAYNLKIFNVDNFFHLHFTGGNSKWCKTDFSQDMEKKVYDKLYIRHYITKSLEEYIVKIRSKCFEKGYRRTSLFFYLNPEMEEKKDELIASIINKEKTYS